MLLDCGATSDFMSMQTAKRGRFPLYKLTHPRHLMTARVVQVKVGYHGGAYVGNREFVFGHHFKILEILPDVVLGLPWLGRYHSTVKGEEQYSDIRHRRTSCRLFFDGSRDSTLLQFQATSRLEVLSTLSSSTSRAATDGSPVSPAKEYADLRSSTYNKSDSDTSNDSNREDGITNDQCSDMEIEYESLPKLKWGISRAHVTADQVFLCCMPRPTVPVDRMHSMQQKNNDGSELDQFRQKLPTQIHKTASLHDRARAEFGKLPPHQPRRDHRL